MDHLESSLSRLVNAARLCVQCAQRLWCKISNRVSDGRGRAVSLCRWLLPALDCQRQSRLDQTRRADLIDTIIFVLFPSSTSPSPLLQRPCANRVLPRALQLPAHVIRLDDAAPLISCVSPLHRLRRPVPACLRHHQAPRGACAVPRPPSASCSNPNSPYASSSSSPHSTSAALPGLTASRYLRLMALSFTALALTAIALTTPLGILAIVLNLTATPVSPWRSLADTHFDFSRVEEIPAFLWRGVRLVEVGVEFTRWAAPLTALVFFGFFGFAVEARKHYALALGAVGKPFSRVLAQLGLSRKSDGKGVGIGYTKPTPTFKRQVDIKRDEISLPAYSPSAGTGSFTAGELKRAGSFVLSAASSSYAYTADARAPSASSSTYTGPGGARFHEDFVVVQKDEIEVSSVYSAAGYWSADGHAYDDAYSPSPASSSTPSRSAPQSTSSSHPAYSSAPPPRPYSSTSSSPSHPAHPAPLAYLELDPDSPLTASSFAHTNRTSASTGSALPPHVAWAEEAYLVSPLSVSSSSFARTNRTSTGSQLPPHVAWAEEAYPASPRSVPHPYGEYEYDGDEAREEEVGAREEGRDGDGEWSPASDAREVSMGEMQVRARTIV
ncbi:pheromone A receptor-domain-containing protein [Mycena polygramma]|nr:pheromone A receptor-domain-containing protein [Mycena polygramma]